MVRIPTERQIRNTETSLFPQKNKGTRQRAGDKHLNKIGEPETRTEREDGEHEDQTHHPPSLDNPDNHTTTQHPRGQRTGHTPVPLTTCIDDPYVHTT